MARQHPAAGRRTRHLARRRRWWYTGAAAVVLVVVGVLAFANVFGDNDPAATEDGGLMASFEMLDGGTGSLADYRGQPLVLNFFASWCVPCLAEMPGFEDLYQQLAGEVGFLGVNLQDEPEAGRQVVKLTGVTYDIARDPDGSLFTTVGGSAMPTTVFIDAHGAIVDVHPGTLTAEALRDRIDQVLLP